jgi:hypothetical protein
MSDVNALSALVAYQQEVVFGYDIVFAKAPLRASDRPTLERFQRDATQAADALRTALKQAGGTPAALPDPRLAPPPKDPSRSGYLRELTLAERNAVASFYNALQQITDERHLRGAAAFMAQGGRRLVVLRHLVGDPLLPRSFETGSA